MSDPIIDNDSKTGSFDVAAPETLSALLKQAVAAGASDVHFQQDGDGGEVLFRMDGLLVPVARWPKELASRVAGRIKYLARLKTYEEHLPQDGRIDRADAGLAMEVRVSTYPTVHGEKIVLRMFEQSEVRPLEQLGFGAEVQSLLKSVLTQDTGLVLLTGPAGSGKTTTIYACLRFLAGLGGRHIITVEDPVEQIVPGVMQTEVQEARGLTYAVAAKHLLRQDPQVLVLGEVRDDETAAQAVRAALTGHLVVSTLHAGSCAGVFERLLMMSGDRHAAVSALELVLNQRLMRRKCAGCGGSGCEACFKTGWRGRVPLVEWLRVDGTARRLARSGELESLRPGRSLGDAAREVLASGLSDHTEYQRLFGGLPEAGPATMS